MTPHMTVVPSLLGARPWWGNDSYHVQSVARQAAG